MQAWNVNFLILEKYNLMKNILMKNMPFFNEKYSQVSHDMYLKVSDIIFNFHTSILTYVPNFRAIFVLKKVKFVTNTYVFSLKKE